MASNNQFYSATGSRVQLAPLYLWLGEMVLVGVMGGLTFITTGDIFNGWMMVFAGLFAVALAGFDWLRLDPTAFEPSTQQVIIVGLAALVGLYSVLSIFIAL